MPFLKYPANPPSVGDPDTIGRRTELYLAMIVCSLLAAVAALRIRAWLAARRDADDRDGRRGAVVPRGGRGGRR